LELSRAEEQTFMASKTIQNDVGQDDYLQLVRRHPLKAIRNDAELRSAYKVIDPLSVIDEDKLSAAQGDYLFALTDLVWAYEQQRHRVDLAAGDRADGIDVLKALMEERGMNASDLGRLLGKRQLGSAILRRERELSKAHVLKLAAWFGVSTDMLLRAKTGGNSAGTK
jgi:antitoxin component HigA of HigAB toxin-antitoxin module